MQANWPPHLRGRIYSAIFARVMIVSIFGKYAAGELLAWDPGFYVWMTPCGASLCLLSLWELRALKVRGQRLADRSAGATVKHFSLAEGREILRQDKPFLWYERVFAMGALINQIGGPLYMLFLAKVACLSWGEYKFLLVLEPIVGWLSVPFWGKMFDHQSSPFRQRALLNVFWGAWPLGYALCALGLGRMAPLGAAEAVKGIADKGSAVNWTLGAVNFAPPGRAAAYNAVHLMYCGLRGFLGVCIGLALYKVFFRDEQTLDDPVFFQTVFFSLCLTAWLSSVWLAFLHRRWGARFRRPNA
jgi:hypothetical protein